MKHAKLTVWIFIWIAVAVAVGYWAYETLLINRSMGRTYKEFIPYDAR